jgi:hypothetical protein
MPSQAALCFHALAVQFGIDACLASAEDRGISQDEGWADAPAVLDVSAMAAADRGRVDAGRIQTLARRSGPTLLLVTDASEATLALLAELAGRTLRVGECCVRTVTFGAHAEELAGATVPRSTRPSLCFELQARPDDCVAMDRGGPAFLSWPAVSHRRWAWATPEVIDPGAAPSAEFEFEERLDEAIPAIIFLRHAFGSAAWHNPRRDAGLVIDDPLVMPRYGFIDFPALLASAREHAYHVSLAFIPWNASRTRSRNASLFRDNRDVFSLCVHGCDHTNNEYGTANHPLLLAKNEVALRRMDGLARKTGLPYAPLAVCPQEQCSIEGWRAFADNRRLLGMVNTGCLPRNIANTRVTVGDLLLPAQDALFGFPAFKRYYPGSMANYALALYLGKPAILVEHHPYFRDGLGASETFASDLRRICPSVRWPSLERLAVRTHWRRRASAGLTEIRFFTRRFELEVQPGDGPAYRIRKRVHDPEEVRSAKVDGLEVPFTLDGDHVVIDATFGSAGIHEIELELKPVPVPRAYPRDPRYHVGVAARRHLSEFRDNVLSRHPGIARAAKSLMNSLGVTAMARAPRKGHGAKTKS